MKQLYLDNRYKIHWGLSWFLVIGLMVIIFRLSGQVSNVSNNLSTGVTEKVVKVVEKVVPNNNISVKELNHYVRKNAHFAIYCVLGFLLINALRRSGYSRKYAVLMAFLLGVFYAITDEVHQGFVPGRGPGLGDVLIDSLGVSVGIGMYLLLYKLIRRQLKKMQKRQ